MAGISAASVESVRAHVAKIMDDENEPIYERLVALRKAAHDYFDAAQVRVRKVANKLNWFGLGAGGFTVYVDGKKLSSDIYERGKAKAAIDLRDVLDRLHKIQEAGELSSALIRIHLQALHAIQGDLNKLINDKRDQKRGMFAELFGQFPEGGKIAEIVCGTKYQKLIDRLSELYVFLKEKESIEQNAQQELANKYPGMKGAMIERRPVKPQPLRTQAATVVLGDEAKFKKMIAPLQSLTGQEKAERGKAIVAVKKDDNIIKAEGLALRRAEQERTVRVSPTRLTGLVKQEEEHKRQRELKTRYSEKPQHLQVHMAGALDRDAVNDEIRWKKSVDGLALRMELQEKARRRGITFKEVVAIEITAPRKAEEKRKMEATFLSEETIKKLAAGALELSPYKIDSSRLFSKTETRVPSPSPSASASASSSSSLSSSRDVKHSPESSGPKARPRNPSL